MPTFLTVVDVNLTVPASEAVHTVTLVVVLLVDAGRSILTGGTVTLVNIQLTVVPIVASQTLAGVLAEPVLAGSSVPTWLVSALIDVCLTSLALPARITVTGPVVDLIPAPTSVTAGILKQPKKLQNSIDVLAVVRQTLNLLHSSISICEY